MSIAFTARRACPRAVFFFQLSVAVGFCLPVPPVAAQPSVSQPVLETVVVTGQRLPTAAGETTAALSSVSERNATESVPLLSADMLRGVPGAFVQQTTPGQSTPIVRGLRGSQVLHLVDGFRLNNAIYRSAPNQYMALVPTAGPQRMELVRGAASVAYGSDAMGGAVQQLSLEPAFDRSLTPFGRLAWMGNSAATLSELGLAWGGSADAGELSIMASDIGSRRVGGGDRIANSGYRSHGLSLRTRHESASGHELHVFVQHMRQPSTPRIDELVPGFGQTEPSSARFDFAPNQRDFIGLAWDPAMDAGWADSGRIQLGWQRIRDDRATRPFGSDVLTRERNSSDLYTLAAVFNKRWSPRARTQYGLDVATDRVSSTRAERAGDQAFQPAAARFPDGASMDTLGVFLQQHFTPRPGTELELGARFSRYRIDLPATQALPAASLEPRKTTLQLGLRQSLGDGLSLLVNAGEAYRAPNVFDLSALGPRPGNRFNAPNRDLAAETVSSYDAGLDWVTDRGSLQAYVFYMDYSDRISSLATGEFTADGREIFTSENLGSSMLYGFELGFSRDLGDQWQLRGTLNWVWAEDQPEEGFTEPGDRIPPLNGRLQLAWRDAGPWELVTTLSGAAAQTRLSSRDVRDPRIDPTGTSGWGLLNVRARRSLGERWEVLVGVDNLLDKRYREHGSGLDAPGRGLTLSLEAPLI